MKKKRIIRKRIRWKFIFNLLLFVVFLVVLFFGVRQIPIERIEIKGTTFTSDNEIIVASGLKSYPKLFDVRLSDIKQKVLEIPTIDDVVVKRNLFGSIIFEVIESRPIFYNRNTGKVILSNGKEASIDSVTGIPMLINYVPDVYYQRLIYECQKLDNDVLNLISEIEYRPWKNGDVVIDETRFFLRMSDGNQVYVNLIHMDKLNNYMQIYATLENKKGFLYLDSSSDKISFSLTDEKEQTSVAKSS